MARLTWIIFAVCVISCSAQFGFGRRSQSRPTKPITQTTNDVLRTFGVQSDDHKCFTMARRPFFMSRMIHYPCQSRQQNVPVLRWFMGPMGPICISYVREPVFRYYRIPLCCPGYTTDRNGKCSIKTKALAETTRRTNEDMMRMASHMKQAMYMRANEEMARRRAMFYMNMRDTMDKRRRNNVRDRPQSMMPRMGRPPMSQIPKMIRMFNARRPSFSSPRVAFLKFNRPTPPMPRPIQRPPVSGRKIKIIKRKFIPFYPLMSRNMFTPQNRMQSSKQNSQRPPVPKLILSGRSDNSPMARMRQIHPQMPPFLQFAAPRSPQSFQPFGGNPDFQPNGFPASRDDQQQQQQDNFHDHSDHHHDHSHDGFNDQTPQDSQISSDIHVDLPSEPVQMPDLVVEQAPADMNLPSCISTLEAAVKSCLKQSNIDVPDVMSAFEPFNDDKSRVLCEAEDTIFNCISAGLKNCDVAIDGEMARDMLLETAQTVQSMCDIREANVANSSPSVQGNDETMATVENVDAIPTDVNSAADPVSNSEITIIEDSATETKPSAEAVKDAIQHEVHVQEMRMKEYLLPILVGSGVGFMVLVLLLSLVICCCCKRRFRKKMKMAKEMEKPPLKDGIYTIGIPPPRYEVNGIPPLYYEEAKGEKITSGSPAVLDGSDPAVLEGSEKESVADGTQM